jgi:hypothetical protein
LERGKRRMKIHETICNVCGKTFDMSDEQEGFGFNYDVGYGSVHDGEKIRLDMCCECFDKVLEYVLPLCKHSPIVKGGYQVNQY